MRAIVRVLVMGSLLAATGGCATTPGGPAAAGAETTATATPTPTPSPTPTVDLRAKWQPVVALASLTTAEAGPAKEDTFNAVFEMPCDGAFTATRLADRAWAYPQAKGGFIAYGVAAYDPQPGTTIVQQARAALSLCTTWKSADNKLEMRILDELAVSRPDGVDAAFAYCYRLDYLDGSMAGKNISVCDAFVTRGNLLATIGDYADTVGPAQRYLKTILPLAAAALVRAAPTV